MGTCQSISIIMEVVVDCTKIFTKIIHISDIHIRLSSRFEEYGTVLKKFTEDIRRYDNSIVVITGDVFHNKNELTPDCVMFAVRFFRTISGIHPVVIIPGNHDFLMNNLEKHDTITSVLHRRNLKNVFYLKESGIYRFGNLVFVHNSLWNPEKKPWIHPLVVEKENKTDMIVSLFHGMVGKCQTLAGYTFDTAETLSPSQFDGSDFVLLGDIHHHQFVRENMAYAGSMISQSFNETGDKHGYILWDVEDKKATFYRLDNPFAYRRVDVYPKDDLYVYLDKSYSCVDDILKEIRPTMRLEVHVHDSDGAVDILPMRKRFQANGLNARIRYHSMQTLGRALDDESVLKNMNDLQNPFSVKSMLERYVTSIGLNPDEIVDAIVKNVDIFQNNGDVHNEKLSWKILELEFENMFGYGKDNHIVFDSHAHPQLVGIFGRNSVGKSTLVDIILFMLYGRITRYASGNSVPQEVIHENENSMYGKLRLEIGTDVYTIVKKGQRNKKSKRIKMTEELWKEDMNGNKMNLTEEHRMKTDKLVVHLIGSMEQFMYLSLCTQVPMKPFREMTQKERKEFLFMLFRLDAFEMYYGKLNGQMKELEIQRKALEMVRKKSVIVEGGGWKEKLEELERGWRACQKKLKKMDKESVELRREFGKYCEKVAYRDGLKKKMRESREKLEGLEREVEELSKEGDVDISMMKMEDIERALEEKRGLLKKLRVKSRKLKSKYQPFVKTPCMDGFSYRKWISLGRHLKMGGGRLMERRRSRENVDVGEGFRYFDRERLMVMKGGMARYEKEEVGRICGLFDKISAYNAQIVEKESMTRYLKDEYKVHRDVEYNEDCEKCVSNPFRRRKNEMESRMKEMAMDVKKLKQKILYETTNVAKEISDSLKLYKEFRKEEGLLGEISMVWTKERYMEEVEGIRKRIDGKIKEIEDFERDLECVMSDRVVEMKKRMEDEYGRMTVFLGKLDEFVKSRWTNIIVEKEEGMITKEMEEVEGECEKYERMMSQHHRMLRKEFVKNMVDMLRKGLEEDEAGCGESEREISEMGDVDRKMGEFEVRRTELARKEMVLESEWREMRRRNEEWEETERKYLENCAEIGEHERLMRVCHRDGFPLYILKTLIPTFNEYINRMLGYFIENKYVRFEVHEDGDVTFETRSHDSDMAFHFYGGMESLMIDLATKITFAHFGYLPTASFFVIDENISVLDEYNVQNIEVLFGFLKQHFEHILLISHLPSIKNIVDKHVCVEKQGGYSKICENV